jgi:RNA-directed DNA polymerase
LLAACDLTFSTNKKDFPPEIAVPSSREPHTWLPGPDLQRIVSSAGFRINLTKTRMQYRDSRQEVTGLVVNQKINVRREYRHNVRAMVDSLFNTGAFELYGPVKKAGMLTVEKRQGTLNELHGRLGFINGIDLYNKKISPPQRKAPDQLSSKELIYRRFLLYRDFYAAETPVILCEGKTDSVYLTQAIRSLAAEFPDLAEVAADGTIKLRVRLYKYPQSSTARVLGLNDGGNAVISSFLRTYKREIERFKAPGLKNACIVLYDRDSGRQTIENTINQSFRVSVKTTDAYVHLAANLYAVPTPLIGDVKESKIEDFFDAATKATILNGKTFSTDNNADISKHYGKKIFAYDVIRPNAGQIDFSGFRPLLTNLVAAIKSQVAPDSKAFVALKNG